MFPLQLMKSASDCSQLADRAMARFIPNHQNRHSEQDALLFFFLPVLSTLAIPLLLCWFANQYLLNRQMATNSLSKSLLFSTMIQSWIWFMYLYGHQFRGLSLFKDFLHSKNAVISTAYMPFVDIGYYVFWIMGVFYLVEFPFLLWYISTKVTFHCFPDYLPCISLGYIVGTGRVHNHIHLLYSKHSTPSPSMYHTMQKVPTAKWSHCVPCPLNFNMWWILHVSGHQPWNQMEHFLQFQPNSFWSIGFWNIWTTDLYTQISVHSERVEEYFTQKY